MNIETAAEWIKQNLPIEGYYSDWFGEYLATWLAEIVGRHARPGAQILDFGSGATDLAAFLSKLGYRVSACDDFQDPWHLKDGNRQKVFDFAQSAGVDVREVSERSPFPWTSPTFDLILVHHVLEHLPSSPRPMMNMLLNCLKDNGVLLIAVPNAANLRKRLSLLRGKTNYPPYVHFFWHEGPWRGHVREYVRDDLDQLARHSGLQIVELGTYHYLLGNFPRKIRTPWKLLTGLLPDTRDSWFMVARKPAGWTVRTSINADDPAAGNLSAIRH